MVAGRLQNFRFCRCAERTRAAGLSGRHVGGSSGAEATGFPRQTILCWHRNRGLKRNSDGTYSLPVFVAWLREFEIDKVTRMAGTAGQDPLREQ